MAHSGLTAADELLNLGGMDRVKLIPLSLGKIRALGQGIRNWWYESESCFGSD